MHVQNSLHVERNILELDIVEHNFVATSSTLATLYLNRSMKSPKVEHVQQSSTEWSMLAALALAGDPIFFFGKSLATCRQCGRAFGDHFKQFDNY